MPSVIVYDSVKDPESLFECIGAGYALYHQNDLVPSEFSYIEIGDLCAFDAMNMLIDQSLFIKLIDDEPELDPST